jgi:hypothetical protein
MIYTLSMHNTNPKYGVIYSTHKKDKIIDLDLWTLRLQTLSDFIFFI